MNGNLSKVQTNEMSDTTKIGAMPIKTNFDGPAPIKSPTESGVAAPNQSITIPKPGFF